jgi:uncharacterized protein (DUF1697 family)
VSTTIALFRGINVGGKNVLPMKELATVLEELGCRNVRTYIQSGNAVFESTERSAPSLARRIGAAVAKRRGFEPRVLLLRLRDVERAIAGNPFPRAESEPASLHVGFLAETPKRPDLGKLEQLRKDGERFRLVGNVFYLHAPAGAGNSKLAAGAERSLGVPMTVRNWRTVCKLRDLAKESR